MFVIDRAAVAAIQAGIVNNSIPRASYILDLSDLKPNDKCTVSGTGFGEAVKQRMKKEGVVEKPVNAIPSSKEAHVGVKPHLPHHYAISSGLPW